MTSESLMSSEFWRNGPSPGAVYNFPGQYSTQNSSQIGAAKRTTAPIVTGTSVLGIKFNGGVLIAADMLGSYGSLARYRNLSRVMKVNDSTILGCGGDYADYQYLQSTIEQRVIDEQCLDDGFSYTPRGLYSWITRILYYRRSQFNPLWNVYVIGGLQDGVPFLGYVDKIGVAYEAPTIATGYGAYIANPLLREAYEQNPNMTLEEAQQQIERCMKILYYRDARSLNKFEVAIVTKDGSLVKPPIQPETNWEIAHMIQGYE